MYCKGKETFWSWNDHKAFTKTGTNAQNFASHPCTLYQTTNCIWPTEVLGNLNSQILYHSEESRRNSRNLESSTWVNQCWFSGGCRIATATVCIAAHFENQRISRRMSIVRYCIPHVLLSGLASPGLQGAHEAQLRHWLSLLHKCSQSLTVTAEEVGGTERRRRRSTAMT